MGRRNPLAHYAAPRRGSVISLRRVLFFIIFCSATLLVLNEWHLEKDRPRIPQPERGFTIRTPEKRFGIGPVEYVYISRADDQLRLGLWLMGAVCVVGGYLWDRRRR